MALLAFATTAACLPSCDSSPSSSCAQTAIVVGVQGEPGLTGVVASYRVTTTIDGARRTSMLSSVNDSAALFPREIRLEASGAEKRVDVRVDAFNTPGVGAEPAGSDPQPVLTRIVSAPFSCGETRLVRLRLEAQCLVSGFPGAFGPSCTAPASCHGGRCGDGSLSAQDLEPYTPTWAAAAAESCKPAEGGPAEVLIGTGQTDFNAINAEALRPEKGPQGGHHIWIAVRIKNLRQSGSITTLLGAQPDTGIAIPITSFVFPYDRDEGGYCKLFGLRYQLDSADNPVERFLSKPLDVTLEVRDTDGASAKTTTRINIGATVIVPAGL